jgi:hypothetical protein
MNLVKNFHIPNKLHEPTNNAYIFAVNELYRQEAAHSGGPHLDRFYRAVNTTRKSMEITLGPFTIAKNALDTALTLVIDLLIERATDCLRKTGLYCISFPKVGRFVSRNDSTWNICATVCIFEGFTQLKNLEGWKHFFGEVFMFKLSNKEVSTRWNQLNESMNQTCTSVFSEFYETKERSDDYKTLLGFDMLIALPSKGEPERLAHYLGGSYGKPGEPMDWKLREAPPIEPELPMATVVETAQVTSVQDQISAWPPQRVNFS